MSAQTRYHFRIDFSHISIPFSASIFASMFSLIFLRLSCSDEDINSLKNIVCFDGVGLLLFTTLPESTSDATSTHILNKVTKSRNNHSSRRHETTFFSHKPGWREADAIWERFGRDLASISQRFRAPNATKKPRQKRKCQKSAEIASLRPILARPEAVLTAFEEPGRPGPAEYA